jgi:omptin family protein
MHHIRNGVISLLIILLLSAMLSAQTKSHTLNFKPYLGINTGTTEYIMDLKDGDGYFLKSQLEFPLDQTMIGGEVELKLKPGTQQEWAFYFGYYTNIADPSGIMYDNDWWNIRTGLTEKISYTESDVEGKNSIFLVELDKMVLIGKKGSLSLTGGFRYQKIDQDIIGFKGWQLDPENNYEPFNFDVPDIEALTYEITYKLPNGGFRINYFLNEKITFQSRIAYTRALISDLDDHVLRFKTSESDITGNGLLTDFGVRMDFGPQPGKGLFVELVGDLTYISASGTSTQSWYGDDPAAEGDETGESVTVPHEVNTTQFRIGLAIGLGL